MFNINTIIFVKNLKLLKMWNHFEIAAYWTKEIKLNLLVYVCFQFKMWLINNSIDKIQEKHWTGPVYCTTEKEREREERERIR